jgi:23S rRNA (cytidine2498-2'-O)-methyltransferase
MPPPFLFAVCQHGSEAALKREVARRHPDFRFAFSRPGFVTFRVPDEAAGDQNLELRSVFARTWGFSLGKVHGAQAHLLARELWKTLGAHYPADRGAQFRHLHVWSRDRDLPGDVGFDPHNTRPAQSIGRLILEQRPKLEQPWPLALNENAEIDDLILDCVLVEPEEWWFGWHRAHSPPTRWPGGVPTIDAPANSVSRAYLKMVEALLWSELPIQAGDRCVEIGSSPGGSCQALLDRGFVVTGIDPAEMDAVVLANPHFTHLRARAKDLQRSVFRDFRWLIADANVAPNYTLDTVEAIVTHQETQISGLLLTLKLTDPALSAHLPSFHKRIRSWGYGHVRARQLAFNRQEVCVAASGRNF